MVKALDKEFSRKNRKKDFAEGLHGSPRQRNYPNTYLKISLPRAQLWALGKNAVSCSPWPNGIFFPRRPASALGKDPFADEKFPEGSLPRVF